MMWNLKQTTPGASHLLLKTRPGLLGILLIKVTVTIDTMLNFDGNIYEYDVAKVFHLLTHCYHSQTKLWEGNVFRGVCLSIRGGGAMKGDSVKGCHGGDGCCEGGFHEGRCCEQAFHERGKR